MVDNNEVSIPDKKLNGMIHRILQKKDDDPITQEEMESIPSINVFNQGVKDLTGLEYVINLEHLIMSYNTIDNLESLKSCVKLKTLAAKYLSTTSISALPTNLEQLDISNLVFTTQDDFTPLSTLTNLQILKISNTNLDSIDFVSSIGNLIMIEANSCQVTDLRSLQTLLDKKLENSSYTLESSTTEGEAMTLALHRPDGSGTKHNVLQANMIMSKSN